MRLRALVAVLVLAPLLPSAAAGSEAAPEVSDPRDHPDPSKDILALWFEDHPDGVKFTVKVASLPAAQPGLLFEVGWSLRDNVAIGFDGTRALRSSVDTPSGWTFVGRGALDDALLEESFRPGSPAYLSGVIPAARFGFEKGDVLTRVRAQSTYWDAQAEKWILGADTAGTLASSYRIGGADGSFFPILVPPWVIPTIVLACTVGGMGAGFAVARWRSTAQAPVATAVPVRTERAPPPPGQRFQRAPPPRR